MGAGVGDGDTVGGRRVFTYGSVLDSWSLSTGCTTARLALSPESEAAGKNLIRAMWLNDHRGETAREQLVAAFEGERDDAGESGTNADLMSGDLIEVSTTRLGYTRHPIRILPRASVAADRRSQCHVGFLNGCM